MKHLAPTSLLALLASLGSASPALAANPGVTLIGVGVVPGTGLDKSGLQGQAICRLDDPTTCTDQATLGGFGSGLTYTGHDNVFLAVNDRGTFDGRNDIPYLDRFHFFYMAVDPSAPFPNIKTVLLDTRFFLNESGENFVGDAGIFDVADPAQTLRLDPESVRASCNGSFFISDEYGPDVFEFDRQGQLLRRLAVPSKFSIAHPQSTIDPDGNSLELYPGVNDSGRQANRGMEGLAITPDGSQLVGIMQNALIQDRGLNTATPPGRVGVNNRILSIDTQTGATREYVYAVDAINQGRGVNDLVAINEHEFLALERDNRSLVPTPPNAAQTPNSKRIYRFDLSQPGLTDVSGVTSLPATSAELATQVPPISAVTKTLFLDLLDPSYVVDATTTPPRTIKDVIAEKVEALSWGPDLPDGRHVLFVLTDNDL
ncbi:MAG TPA: esterase-like activity of phytase family protein, partial [Polyangiaceae bacterium]|nr:esterase-like activity of phytase family protein [Polyangiaceae bacterium]